MASWTKSLLATLALTFAASAPAEGLAFRWSTEVSHALPYEAQAMQGESFTLEARLVQYGQPMAGSATAKFYYQTKDMEKHQWYTAPAAWANATGTVSATWTPAMDVGATAYRWFFGVDTAEGKNYRVYGTLRLKQSPGFNPAELVPEDVRQEVVDEILKEVKEWAEGRFLSAERIDQTLDAPAADRVPSSALLDGQLAAKANKTHTHRISEVTLLQGALDKKADADDLDLKADKTHTHTQAQVSGLSAALAAKANATHTHTTSAITDLYATLNPLYAAKGHDHTLENVGMEIRQELLSKAEEGHTHEWIEIVGLMDTLGGYLTKAIAEETYQPKGDYLTAESDPTVPAWAKAPQKPTYTAAEVGAAQASHTHAQAQIEGLTEALGTYLTKTLAAATYQPKGDYLTAEADPTVPAWAKSPQKPTYTAAEVGAAQASHTHAQAQIEGLTEALGTYLTKTLAAATYQPKGDYLTAESDPTVPAWAKAPQKPTYTAAEVGAAQASHTHADLAPLSAVSMTTNGVTYLWVWDERAGCHALTKNGAEPIYAD